MTKKNETKKTETKLTSQIKKHLMGIATSFANNQKVNSEKAYDQAFERAAEAIIQKSMTKEMEENLKKIGNLEQKLSAARQKMHDLVQNTDLEYGSYRSNPLVLKREVVNKIKSKLDSNRNIQWDVILSSVALRIELCQSYDEAKEIIKEVTGADVESMVTTIIPPQFRLN